MPRETGSKPSGDDSKIIRQGHTATQNHGTDPNIKGKVQKPHDLKR